MYIRIDTGVKNCPNGFNEITDTESCRQAATTLGLGYIESSTTDANNDHLTCLATLDDDRLFYEIKYGIYEGDIPTLVCKNTEGKSEYYLENV